MPLLTVCEIHVQEFMHLSCQGGEPPSGAAFTASHHMIGALRSRFFTSAGKLGGTKFAHGAGGAECSDGQRALWRFVASLLRRFGASALRRAATAPAMRTASGQYCISGGVPGSGRSPSTPFGPGCGTSTAAPPVEPAGIVLCGDGRVS